MEKRIGHKWTYDKDNKVWVGWSFGGWTCAVLVLGKECYLPVAINDETKDTKIGKYRDPVCDLDDAQKEAIHLRNSATMGGS